MPVVVSPTGRGRPWLALGLGLGSLLFGLGVAFAVFIVIFGEGLSYHSDHVANRNLDAVIALVCVALTTPALFAARLGWRSRDTGRGIAAMVLSLLCLLVNLGSAGLSALAAVNYARLIQECAKTPTIC